MHKEIEEPKMKVTIHSRFGEMDEDLVKFQLKIQKNKIPNGQQAIKSVILMIKLKSGSNFQEIIMNQQEESIIGFRYDCVVEILKKEEYQYFYKVNSESETDFDIKVDEWNKIWIGYSFLLPQEFVQYQIQQNKECHTTLFDFFPKIFENFQLVNNTGIWKTTEILSKNYSINQKSDQIQYKFVLCSNCLIVEFTFDFSQFHQKHQGEQKLNQFLLLQEEINEKNTEIMLLENKLNHHQQIYSNYTNNLNGILNELTQETSQVSNEQIQVLLTPIQIPQIREDLAFQKCKQSLIKINGKLEDIKTNNLRIQDQYDTLRMAYDQGIQQLSDYERISQQKDDKNLQQIKRLKLELNNKMLEIQNLIKDKNKAQIKYRIRIQDAKKKYHEEVLKQEAEINQLIEFQQQQEQLISDRDRKIQLQDTQESRLKNLIRKKDAFILSQSDYITILLNLIKNYKEL